MTETPMMKCGHAANAKDEDGKPVCAICILQRLPDDENDPARIVVGAPNLEGRQAACVYRHGKSKLHGIVASSTELAFFEHCPDEQYDKYYCGCMGWD